MTVRNEEKKAFRDLTPEERSEIVESWLVGSVEVFGETEWAPAAHNFIVHDLPYRTRPRQLAIPWEVIKPEFKWAAMDKNGKVHLFGDKPKMYGDGFMADIVCNTRALNIDTAGINWRESLTQRPEGV